MERMTLAIDVACQVVLQASLADASCRLAGSGRRLRTTAAGLDRLRESLPAGIELSVVTDRPQRSAADGSLVPGDHPQAHSPRQFQAKRQAEAISSSLKYRLSRGDVPESCYQAAAELGEEAGSAPKLVHTRYFALGDARSL